jgi:hypothetical protein
LSLAVLSADVAATGTALTGVRWIDPQHANTFERSFVGEEDLKASEAPRVKQAVEVLARSHPLSDVGQVLHRNGITWLHSIDDSLTQNVVTVVAETVFPLPNSA